MREGHNFSPRMYFFLPAKSTYILSPGYDFKIMYCHN